MLLHLSNMATLLLIISLAAVIATDQPMVIDLTTTKDIQTRIAVQICSGLLSKQGVYTLMNEPYDSDWLSDLYHVTNPHLTSVSNFMFKCLSSTPNVTGYIRYNYTLQHTITPNLITLSAMLKAVLLEDTSPYISNDTRLVFDAVEMFGNSSGLAVSRYMFANYVSQTSTLAFMAPNNNPGLIDYIVKEKIFNFWLSNACIRSSPEYDFVLQMTDPRNNPWNNPINVMGYNSAWPVAGDLFEAETDCNSLHNMGQVASDGFNNLAFLSLTANITKPLLQNPSKYLKLNRSKTYIAFTIGDGDNLSYIKSSRRNWMLDRVNRCKQSNFSYLGCFPLQWSISPHLLYLAPLMLEWYFNQSYLTGNDYFVLPPSGHLYSYPSEMDFNTTQKNFIRWTEEDCALLSCDSTVAWEFVFRWFGAIKDYFPRYAKEGHTVRGLYAVNVPYNIPVYDFWANWTTPDLQFYKILGTGNNSVVLFKPREWRGTNNTRGANCLNVPFSYWNCLSVDEMAYEINHYPKPTVTQIYITSDGGGNLDMLYALVPKLNESVQLVSPTQLIQLALQRG